MSEVRELLQSLSNPMSEVEFEQYYERDLQTIQRVARMMDKYLGIIGTPSNGVPSSFSFPESKEWRHLKLTESVKTILKVLYWSIEEGRDKSLPTVFRYVRILRAGTTLLYDFFSTLDVIREKGYPNLAEAHNHLRRINKKDSILRVQKYFLNLDIWSIDVLDDSELIRYSTELVGIVESLVFLYNNDAFKKDDDIIERLSTLRKESLLSHGEVTELIGVLRHTRAYVFEYWDRKPAVPNFLFWINSLVKNEFKSIWALAGIVRST